MSMINPKLTDQDGFELMMYYKRSVAKISLFIGMPLMSALAIKNIIKGDPFMTFMNCVMLLILILLGFVIMRRIEEKSEYKIYSVLFRLLNAVIGVSLLYGIGFQSNFSRIEWCYIYPVFVFFAVGLKEGIIWTSVFYGILAFLILNFDLQGVTLFQIQELRSRFLVSFFAVCILSLFLERGFRRVQQRLLHHQHNLKESENRYRQAYEKMNIEVQERKRAEEGQLNAIQQWQSTFDSITDMVSLLDLEGKILRCNMALKNFVGKPFNEILNRSFWEIMLGTKTPIENCPLLRMKETLHREATTFPFNDRWFNVSVDPILDEAGSLIGAVNIMSEITDRKRAEEERLVLQEQLRQSQKMEAIGQLAGGIAHDFNNLLTVIIGYSDLILRRLNQNDSMRGNAEEIKRSAEKAASLTQQLLAFGRKQMLQSKVLDLRDLVANMEKMLRRVIGENIDLITLSAKDLGRIKADPAQIEQVILNLAVNAKDAMPNGGKLIIETTNVELDEAYAHTHIEAPPGRYVMLSVSDTGCGMTPEIRERIFDPFFTTKEKGKGTGLGLSTVYGIVKQSGGNIWVYSELGQGTTFKVYLPRIEEDVESLRSKDAPKKSPQGNEIILVVEDDEVVRKAAVIILQKNGYSVLEATNGEEALRLAQENHHPMHLLLTDVVMPGMSGLELAKNLTLMHPETKVIYMSGYTDNTVALCGILKPEMTYLQKPFTSVTLARKVREVLDEHS